MDEEVNHPPRWPQYDSGFPQSRSPPGNIPITFEQPGKAARVRWTGTEEMITLGRLQVEKLRQTIKKVLSSECFADETSNR